MSAVSPRNAWWVSGLLLLAMAAAPLHAQQATIQAARRAPMTLPTSRIIVKWRESGVAAVQIDSLADRTARLRNATGMRLDGVRSVASRLDVVRLRDRGAEATMRDAVQLAVARLRADPSVEYAEADERIFVLAAPNDPRYVAGSDAIGSWQGQWYLADPSATAPAAIGAVTAWDTNQGANINVAVLDTGVVLDHPDLAGQFLVTKDATHTPIGFDFVCNDVLTQACTATGTLYYTANDGNGWDADPSDPGDWISAADLLIKDPNDATGKSYLYAGCGSGTNHDEPEDSSWHGTRVSGILAAVANNGIGIAGAAPGIHIMPVRIIGKCAGYTSDLVAALYWAGGLSNSVLGSLAAPAIHANIINLSLGNRLPCSQAEQDAITALNGASVLVVAAAGNDGGPVGAPANCTGVLSVAGIRHLGTKVGYSNVSSTAAAVSIAAPAGNCINTGVNQPCLYSLDTLSNEGKTTPVASSTLTSYTYSSFNAGYAGNALNNANIGTSFASPLVSAVAAMMASVNGNLLPSEVIQRMQQAATPFPVPATAATGGVCHVASLAQDSSKNYTDVQDRDCQCTTAACGAGMLNAPAAIAAALRPIALLKPSSTVGSIGQRISVDASTSLAANGHTIVAYQWSTDPSLSIVNANGAVAEFIFPALRPITVTLTVTDEAGRRDSTSAKIESTLTASSTTNSDGITSGGGSMGLELVLLGLLAWRGTETRRKCRYACRIEQGR
jgi:serine protease